MSVWTHLSGIVRIDAIPYIHPANAKEIEEIFQADIPTGSEGPARVKAVHAPWLDNPPAYVVDPQWGFVGITGDLRDFGEDPADIHRVYKWIQTCVMKLQDSQYLIRQALLMAETEYRGGVVWVYEDSKWRAMDWQKITEETK